MSALLLAAALLLANERPALDQCAKDAAAAGDRVRGTMVVHARRYPNLGGTRARVISGDLGSRSFATCVEALADYLVRANERVASFELALTVAGSKVTRAVLERVDSQATGTLLGGRLGMIEAVAGARLDRDGLLEDVTRIVVLSGVLEVSVFGRTTRFLPGDAVAPQFGDVLRTRGATRLLTVIDPADPLDQPAPLDLDAPRPSIFRRAVPRLRIAAGMTAEPARRHHADAIHVVRGRGTLVRGAETTVLAAGATVVVPAGEAHTLTAGPGGLDLLRLTAPTREP